MINPGLNVIVEYSVVFCGSFIFYTCRYVKTSDHSVFVPSGLIEAMDMLCVSTRFIRERVGHLYGKAPGI